MPHHHLHDLEPDPDRKLFDPDATQGRLPELGAGMSRLGAALIRR